MLFDTQTTYEQYLIWATEEGSNTRKKFKCMLKSNVLHSTVYFNNQQLKTLRFPACLIYLRNHWELTMNYIDVIWKGLNTS